MFDSTVVLIRRRRNFDFSLVCFAAGRDVLAGVPKALYRVLTQGSDRHGEHPRLCEHARPVAPMLAMLGLRKNQKEMFLACSAAQ